MLERGWGRKCAEGGRAGTTEGQAVVLLSYSLLPTTSPHGLETFASLLRVFHIVLLLLENQFFCLVLFYNVIYCHVLVLIFS